MKRMIALLLATLVFAGCGDWPGGMSPTHQAQDHDPKLTAYAKTALPMITVAIEFREKKGVLPTYEQLLALLPAETGVTNDSAYMGWHYSVDGNEFQLVRKLGWDPCLLYRSKDDSWTFCPGDGSEDITVKLNPEQDKR